MDIYKNRDWTVSGKKVSIAMKMIPAHTPPHNKHELVKSLTILFRKRERVKEIFENEVKNLLQTDNYLTVSSGRRALYIGLKGLEISKGDEVILPAFTTDIVPMIVREAGAIPIPVDVNVDDYNIDVDSVIERITNKTKAILTVHTFGYPSDVKALREICEDRDLFFIEDAAPAFGAKYEREPVGTFGDVGIISFGVGKSISMGTGGGLIVSDEKVFGEIKKWILPKEFKNSAKIFVKILGSILLSNPYLYGVMGCKLKDGVVSHQYDNYKEEIIDGGDISLLSYAIGIQEVDSKVFERRRKIALEYTDLFKKFDGVYPPVEKRNIYPVYTRYFLRVETKDMRNNICERMRKSGIEPLIPDHGYPISENLYPSGFQGDIPNARMLSETLIGIPVHRKITDNELAKIFECDVNEK
ncbi:MAG: DegT/DnrJ/EryC1/StrS family aminotransferase [Methanosarcinales archaeon]|nr:DegT/DnrJ/EryC1/StrS family aminotransferase [Methanosarcinales archaeon]